MASEMRLLPRTKVILGVIQEFIGRNGLPPTIREIQTAAGISSTSVVDYHLRILKREGYLARQPVVSRGITLTDRGRAATPEQQGSLGDAMLEIIEHAEQGMKEPFTATVAFKAIVDTANQFLTEKARA